MQYSEHPHLYYISGCEGPGAIFVGDVERWNWRWLLHGTKVDPDKDLALLTFFNENQRELMKLEPIKAAEILDTYLPRDLMPGVWERATEAQDRLYPPVVATVRNNVIHVNFRR